MGEKLEGHKEKGLLKNKHGECLSCAHQCGEKGGKVKMTACDKHDTSQVWTYKKKGDHFITKNAESDFCLDAKVGDEKKVEMNHCADQRDQEFKVEEASNPDFGLIKAVGIDKCLTAKHGVSVDECKDVKHTDKGQWKFKDA